MISLGLIGRLIRLGFIRSSELDGGFVTRCGDGGDGSLKLEIASWWKGAVDD